MKIFKCLEAKARRCKKNPEVLYTFNPQILTFQRFEGRSSQPMVIKPTLVPLVPGASSTTKSSSRDFNSEAVIGHHRISSSKQSIRTQLQRNRNLVISQNMPAESNQPWSVNQGRIYHRQESLPSDFKATVATLPPIQSKPREVNVQSLAVDLDFVKVGQKKPAFNVTTNQSI